MNTKKNFAFLWLNLLSCIFVVLLHVRVSYWAGPVRMAWWVENAISLLGMVAVPTFFMLSGANLLGYPKRCTTKTYFRRRLEKVGIPFVFWTIVALLWALGTGHYEMGRWTKIPAVFLTNDVNPTFWYFRPQFALYLVIPLFAIFLQAQREREKAWLDFLLALCMLQVFFIPLGRTYFPKFLETFTLPVGHGYLVYLLIGYRLVRYPLSNREFSVLSILAVIGVFLFFFGSPWITPKGHALDLRFASYLTLPLFFWAVWVFAVFTHPKGQKLWERAWNPLCDGFSKLTFGIYLVHYPILKTCDDILRNFGMDIGSVTWLVLRFLIVFTLSVILVAGLRKTAWGRKLLPA